MKQPWHQVLYLADDEPIMDTTILSLFSVSLKFGGGEEIHVKEWGGGGTQAVLTWR